MQGPEGSPAYESPGQEEAEPSHMHDTGAPDAAEDRVTYGRALQAKRLNVSFKQM